MNKLFIFSVLLLSSSQFYDVNAENNFKPSLDLKQNSSCKYCDLLINTIDHELKNGNKTINVIEDIVEEICRLSIGPAGKECEFIVNNLQFIINDLIDGVNSTIICNKLHLCNNLLNNIIPYSSNSSCKICTILVNIIDKELKLGNKTINDIENIVEDICHIIGGMSGNECLVIVDDIQKIINMLLKGLNSLQICDSLHFCNKSLY